MRIILVLMAALLLIAGCQVETNPSDNNSTNPISVSENQVSAKHVANGNNDFGIKLFSDLSKKEGNIFISPYSIYSAFGMVYEGASGDTKNQMNSVLWYEMLVGDVLVYPSDRDRRDGFYTLSNNFNLSKNTTLSTANALWIQNDYKILDSYSQLTSSVYKARAYNVDFMQKENARLKINGWTEDNTNGKIKDLIPTGSLRADSRLVLTNAVYFNSSWKMKFEKRDTQDKDFTTGSGSKVKVPMMRQTSKFGYMEDSNVQILEMPYIDDKLSMVLILPKGDLSLAKLDLQKVKESESKLENQKVNVFVPRFKFTSKFELSSQLKSMGMTEAFSDNADFSAMTGNKDLKIGFVIHQAYVDVNEEGTEAAAATAIGMTVTSMPVNNPIPTFMADKPFIFMIKDKSSGTILFIGKVNNPKE